MRTEKEIIHDLQVIRFKILESIRRISDPKTSEDEMKIAEQFLDHIDKFKAM